MTNLDERVGHLEGRMLEQAQAIADVRDGVIRIDTKLSDSMARLDTKLTDSVVRLDTRISSEVARLETTTSDGFARLDDKMSRQFIWTVGMLVTVLAAVVGGLISR